jgi:hypothetical protein
MRIEAEKYFEDAAAQCGTIPDVGISSPDNKSKRIIGEIWCELLDNLRDCCLIYCHLCDESLVPIDSNGPCK